MATKWDGYSPRSISDADSISALEKQRLARELYNKQNTSFWDKFKPADTSNAGGLGTFGTYTAPDGTAVGLNEDAFNKVKSSGYDGTLSKNEGFFGSDGFGMSDALGLGKLGVGLGSLYLADQQLGLAKDQFKYNKAARDRDYAANVQKYNNSLARTNAVNSHYGVANSGKML